MNHILNIIHGAKNETDTKKEGGMGLISVWESYGIPLLSSVIPNSNI